MQDTNIKLILGFLFELAAKIETVVAGGGVSILQLPSFIGLLTAVGPALAAIKELPSEVSAINDASLADIRSYISSQLGTVVPNANADKVINDGLALAQQFYDYVLEVKGLKSPAVAQPTTPSSGS